jgi:hypothetical protein
VRVRTATRHDLDAFRRLALTAAGETPLNFPPPVPSPVVKRCLLASTILVAEDGDGRLLGYAIAERRTDHVVLTCAVADPKREASAAIASLVAAMRRAIPTLPCATQITLGDVAREQVLEAEGFVPGEVEPLERHGFEVITRRWWAEALAPEP